MGLKGQVSVVFIIFVVLTLVIVLYNVGLNWWFSGSRTERITSRAELQSEVYAANNALVAAKSYAETALDYSVYQAIYDTLRRGGWNEIPRDRRVNIDGTYYTVWYRDREESLPSIENVKNSLTRLIKRSMDIYTGENYHFLDEYSVSLPDYKIVVILNEHSIDVMADSESNLQITKTQESGEVIHLEKDPLIKSTYDIDINDILRYGMEVGKNLTELLRKREEGFTSTLPRSGSKEKTVSFCPSADNPDITDNEVLEEVTGKTVEEFRTNFQETIDSILSEITSSVWQNGYTVEIKKAGDTGLKIIPTCEWTCKPDGDKFVSRKTCTFDYSTEYTLLVSITDTSERFPVYNGRNIALEPPRLFFVIKSE
ncbi:MAG TPA: hypothetical protein ENG00_00440 [Candidatus Aenigmarchaeota archaeon]|nr:hypothetical protein [Candidatus Aenigmarchaeota archaeon]